MFRSLAVLGFALLAAGGSAFAQPAAATPPATSPAASCRPKALAMMWAMTPGTSVR